MKIEKTIKNSRVFRPAEIYRLVTSVHKLKKRNLLRGYIAKEQLTNKEIEEIRRGNSCHDSMLAGAILKGPHGLAYGSRKSNKTTSTDLLMMTGIPALDWASEVCYTSGYINSMNQTAIEILRTIKDLVRLETMDSESAFDLLLKVSKEHGASNFLSYKLAYLRTARDLSPTLLDLVSQIEDEILHREDLGFHFSALEQISPDLSLFVVAQKRTSELVGRVGGDIRKAVSLSNFVPTPLDEEDVSGFLLRATESCLLDTVHSVLVIFNLASEFELVVKQFKLRLDPNFLQQLEDVIKFASESKGDNIITDYYRSQSEVRENSLDLYRISSVFLERPRFAEYRNKIDRVIGARLLAEVIRSKGYRASHPFDDKTVLLGASDTQLDEPLPIKLDPFYRTYLFLRFIEHKQNLLNLSSEQIKFIFENTLGLETLLTEEEMNVMQTTASPETKSLVAVLALALYRKKSIDQDVDFRFRADFISHIKAHHNGSILTFINYLLSDSPQVANYIVTSLDEVTLQKMYGLVVNESQASEIRSDILRAVGQRLNRLEYIIKADEITTRSKVSQLIKYFDSSRMYVDSVAMKKWLDSNPTVSTKQYRSLYSALKAKITSDEDASVPDAGVREYLISQIAEDAFGQFCLNTEFGIESYLGRRIRHNTLDGVTTDTVDAVLRKPVYRNATSTLNMQRAVDAWMSSFKAIIDRLRRDRLQYKSSSSLFKSTLDLNDTFTKNNLRRLSSEVMSAGGHELLNDLVISFCWRQIAPQLEHAARFIRTTLLLEANASIDKHFSGTYSAVEAQIRSDLHQSVNEVFKKIADWFQVPQTGFVSASVSDLCRIILLELHRQNTNDEFIGDAVDTRYTGISVHRLYDCLAVLLQNALKHGEPGKPIRVSANACQPVTETAWNVLMVDITSTATPADYMNCKQRILRAIEATEAGTDMVTEGYTGIKKIKFITRASEGKPTLQILDKDDTRELMLRFTLRLEPANEEFQTGTGA